MKDRDCFVIPTPLPGFLDNSVFSDRMENGNPVLIIVYWIQAFAGMTNSDIPGQTATIRSKLRGNGKIRLILSFEYFFNRHQLLLT